MCVAVADILKFFIDFYKTWRLLISDNWKCLEWPTQLYTQVNILVRIKYLCEDEKEYIYSQT